MAFVYIGNGIYVGESTDVKGDITNPINNVTIFVEKDTGDIYVFHTVGGWEVISEGGPSGGGGGGGGAPDNASYVTLGTNATLSTERVLTEGTGIDLTDGGAGSSVTVSIDSSVTTNTGSQTLTNKTLTTPVISSISNTGTLTLPTSTDTLVGKATTDTLTNKTIDAEGTGNSITNIKNSNIKASAGIVYSKLTLTDSIVNADVNSSAAIATSKLADSANFALTNQANTFGDFNQTFKDDKLKINNPADTFAYTVVGGAIGANRNLTLPVLTGNDTAVTEAHTQTLTNKTINASSNTLSNIPDSAITALSWSKLTGTAAKLDDLAAPDDNTDLNASTGAHGLLKKLDNDATHFLDGQGAWDTVSWTDIASKPSTFAPSTHASSHGDGGTDEISIDYSQITTGVPTTFTPSAHATSHKSGGGDAIKIDELAAPTDVTTLNATTSAHGLLKKLDNNSAHFMDGTGNWSTPAGTGVTAIDDLSDVDTTTTPPADGDVLTWDDGNSEWIAAAPTGGGGGPLDLDDLTDVTIVEPVENDVLVYDGFDWMNRPIDYDYITNKPSTFAPSTHATSHKSGGGDSIKLDELAAPTDVTTLNASTSTHGLLKKLDNDATHFLDGTGAWDTVSWTDIASKPSVFTPDTHKSSHVSGGGDTFAKNDVLVAASSYLDDIADPASDAQRIWIEDGGDDIRYWSDEGTPIKHSVASASNTITFTNKTIDADGTGNSITNIENADIKSGANIAYSKLNLSGSIVNADVNSSAAITTSKLADSANFILKNQANTYDSAQLQTFRSSYLAINDSDDSHKYTIIGSNLAANRNITLPLLTGNDTAVTEAHSQTLTNKTIDADSNTISNIENADVKSAAGIVYSKLNLSGGIVNADINSSAAIVTSKLADSANFVLTNQANTFGAFNQTFPHQRLLIGDSDASHAYTIAGSNLAANRTVTLPLLTGNDVFVTEAFTQTLTNKTLTTPIITSISNSGTITIPTGTDTLVGKATTDTLTNKTLTTPTLTTPQINGFKTASASKTGAYTLTDTDNVILADASSAGFTLTLPAASGRTGMRYMILKTDSTSNAVVIDPNSSETINGATTLSLTVQYQSVIITCNGSNWFTGGNSAERTGSAQANGDASTTLFNIAHGLGSTPSNYLVQCTSLTTTFTSTADSTNIAVTFSSAPGSGTNNVKFQWRAVA